MSSEEINERLLSFLFEYRNSVHCSTNETPAKLMFGRVMRSKLDLILPSNEHDNEDITSLVGARKFEIGQSVWVRCFVAQKPVWRVGTIVNKVGNRMFTVDVRDSGKCIRHVDQLLRYSGNSLIHDSDAALATSPPAAASADISRPLILAPAPAPAPTSPALRPYVCASAAPSTHSPVLMSMPDANEGDIQHGDEPFDVASDNDFYECIDLDGGGEETDRLVSDTNIEAPNAEPASSGVASTEQRIEREHEGDDHQSDPIRSRCVLRPRIKKVNYK
jgi:hypothetical protein